LAVTVPSSVHDAFIFESGDVHDPPLRLSAGETTIDAKEGRR
jgi:hypothetical protein